MNVVVSMAAVRAPEPLKIFISYSRRDATVADALADTLAARGFKVIIDRRDLPFGEKWQAELAEFISLSDTVIWLVSDTSIQSKWVNWELDEVAKRKKRLVPVLVTDTSRDALPRQLGEIHILPVEGCFDVARDLDQLIQVLETDREWIKQASRLQDRASEWLTKNSPASLLLSRGALVDAERWKDRRPAKAPAPTQEILDLILASRRASARRLRLVIAGTTVATLLSLILAGYAFFQKQVADGNRVQAVRTLATSDFQRGTSLIANPDTASEGIALLARSA